MHPYPYLGVQSFLNRHCFLLDKFYQPFLHCHIIGSCFVECFVDLSFERCKVFHKFAALYVSISLVVFYVLEKSLKALLCDNEPLLVRLVPVCYFVIHQLQLGLHCAYLDILILLYVNLKQ